MRTPHVAAEPHRLVVAPPVGAWTGLGHGVVGAAVFGWLLTRWWRIRRSRD